MSLEIALHNAQLSFSHIEFAMRLHVCCISFSINVEQFKEEISVVRNHRNNKDERLEYSGENFHSQYDLVDAAEIVISHAFGSSAISLDAAWNIAGIGCNPNAEEHLIKLRTLVYMVRCALAHNIANPKWKASKRYAKLYEIQLPSSILSIDLQNLNGENLCFSHLGGIKKWYEIGNISVEKLKSRIE